MNLKDSFIKISDWLWEIPLSFRKDMKVPVRIYASEKILKQIEETAINQAINVATLPGIINYSFAMPDIHSGYGFCIGGVAATDPGKGGVISPGGVGYDIACSVRLLKSNYQIKEIKPFLEKLTQEIYKEVPSGLGKGRKIKLSIIQINKILEGGVPYLVEQGYGDKNDVEYCEERGKMVGSDVSCVSEYAKNRGRDQLGTLGSGNHFIEIQKVEEIFDQNAAKTLGLFNDQVVIMIHCGSRGLGHQIAADYIKVMIKEIEKYKINLPDRELACAPFNSPEAQSYFKAMQSACNFSWANRQMISYYIRKAWKKILGEKEKLELVYDVSHNTAKVENNKIIHRKGATRAFPPGHKEVTEKYRQIGQPVIIPGSMGTSSYVLVGTEKGKEVWYSSCHGAGRRMSRYAALKAASGQEVIKKLKLKGIVIKCHSLKGIVEEAPFAYKDINEVVDVIDKSGLSKKVAKMVPLAVIKGE